MFWRNDLKICLETIEKNKGSFSLDIDYLDIFVICLEDRRYFSHQGFDILSIIRVCFLSLLGKKAGGASTIEQQLVRTITQDKRKSMTRKIKEILISFQLSRNFSKREILNAYIYLAYFGTNMVGASVAANKFYGKKRELLTQEESAIIAGLLRYPTPTVRTQAWTSLVERRAKYAQHIEKSIRSSNAVGKWVIGFFGYRLTIASRELKNLLPPNTKDAHFLKDKEIILSHM